MIAKRFWKKWENARDRTKVLKPIQRYIEQDWKALDSIKTMTSNQRTSLKIRNLNSYFEDLYEVLGKRNTRK